MKINPLYPKKKAFKMMIKLMRKLIQIKKENLINMKNKLKNKLNLMILSEKLKIKILKNILLMILTIYKIVKMKMVIN